MTVRALTRLERAHRNGTGIRLSAEDVQALAAAGGAEIWKQPPQRQAMNFTSRQAKRRIEQILRSLVAPASRAVLEHRLHMSNNSAQAYLRHLQDLSPPLVKVVATRGCTPIFGLTNPPTEQTP